MFLVYFLSLSLTISYFHDHSIVVLIEEPISKNTSAFCNEVNVNLRLSGRFRIRIREERLGYFQLQRRVRKHIPLNRMETLVFNKIVPGIAFRRWCRTFYFVYSRTAFCSCPEGSPRTTIYF